MSELLKSTETHSKVSLRFARARADWVLSRG